MIQVYWFLFKMLYMHLHVGIGTQFKVSELCMVTGHRIHDLQNTYNDQSTRPMLEFNILIKQLVVHPCHQCRMGTISRNALIYPDDDRSNHAHVLIYEFNQHFNNTYSNQCTYVFNALFKIKQISHLQSKRRLLRMKSKSSCKLIQERLAVPGSLFSFYTELGDHGR